MINVGQAKIPISTVHVSVVDAFGKEVLVPLESVRRTLNRLIGADTILIGHALDNDLRAPHLVHRQVVDSAALPYPWGPPHRRALRDL